MSPMNNLYTNVYSCALRRWAAFANGKTEGDQRRANDEKQTAYLALALASKFPRQPL